MEDMDKDAMRQGLLMELIDSMHGRLADKMFPPNPDMASEPAASGIPASEAATATAEADKMPEHGDDMSDEDLDEMMKSL